MKDRITSATDRIRSQGLLLNRHSYSVVQPRWPRSVKISICQEKLSVLSTVSLLSWDLKSPQSHRWWWLSWFHTKHPVHVEMKLVYGHRSPKQETGSGPPRTLLLFAGFRHKCQDQGQTKTNVLNLCVRVLYEMQKFSWESSKDSIQNLHLKNLVHHM